MSRAQAERAGRLAELLATFFLRCKGYTVLERRWRTGVGEVDIVARRGEMIVFVEVKHRRSVGAALISMTPAGERRIGRAATVWLGRYRERYEAVRYDLIAFQGWRPMHIRDAFRPTSGVPGEDIF